MACPDALLRVHQQGRTITCQVKGRATMQESPSLCELVQVSLLGGPTVLRVDLSECPYMDSTFLGTLIMLKRAIDRRGEGGFSLVCPSQPCQRLLEQMRLDRVLPIVHDAGALPDAGWTELAGQRDGDAFKQNVVEAHQALSRLSGVAGKTFAPVAARLKEEWDAETCRRAAAQKA